MKQILVIKDPECEVGFDALCNYAQAVQEHLGSQITVLPIWPHGEMQLLGDKRQMKLVVKELKELALELEAELNKEEKTDGN